MDRGFVSEGIHLLVVAPMLKCGEMLDNADIVSAANRVKSSFLKKETINQLGLLNFNQRHMLTHFYAYIMEALVELGRTDLAQIGMKSVAKHQKSDGGVPGYFDVTWLCTTGMSQLAMVWYRIGEIKRAELALGKVIRDLQNKNTGGFYGSVGHGANYFPDQEISWAVKYTLDALYAISRAHFDKTYGSFPTQLRSDDGRLKVIVDSIESFQLDKKRQNANFRILDVGAGKGRFASALRRMYPSEDFEVFATDLSDKMLSFVPDNIQSFQASVTSLPFPDNYFDVVFAIEVLEHVPIYEHAIVEIKRVLKPSGRIIIIDKNAADPRAELWSLDPWEQWFHDDDMLAVFEEVSIPESAVLQHWV